MPVCGHTACRRFERSPITPSRGRTTLESSGDSTSKNGLALSASHDQDALLAAFLDHLPNWPLADLRRLLAALDREIARRPDLAPDKATRLV
jgi:hypothetical protein